MVKTNVKDSTKSVNSTPKSTDSNLSENLFSQSPENYGDKYKDHYLDIYKIFVETTDKISDRRYSSNSFFLTINTVIITLVGYLQLGKEAGQSIDFYWLVSSSGIVVCFAWYRLIRSYKDLNSAKFKIIHLIEKQLPLSVYDAEWEALDRGVNPKTYLQFSKIERVIPLIFFTIHIVVLIKAILIHVINSL